MDTHDRVYEILSRAKKGDTMYVTPNNQIRWGVIEGHINSIISEATAAEHLLERARIRQELLAWANRNLAGDSGKWLLEALDRVCPEEPAE